MNRFLKNGTSRLNYRGKMKYTCQTICLFLVTLIFTGCVRNSEDVWDDTKTAGRHVQRGLCSLAGKHGDSRQVRCREEFFQCYDDFDQNAYASCEFEPLPDVSLGNSREFQFRPSSPRIEPGETGKIPGIEGFQDPKNDGRLSGIFRTVYFPYNSSLMKGKENMDALRSVARYMKEHPSVYIFVEGHCDERGAEAFNLALGARRSNSVRAVLMEQGIGPERIFTVSYGKERPIASGHHEEAWAKNRRVEFKVFEGRG